MTEPAAAAQTRAPRVLLVLVQGFEDLEAVSVLDIFGWTQYREWIPTVDVVTCGFSKRAHSRFGLAIDVDLRIDEVRPEDYAAVALPGGFHSHGFDEADDARLHELLRRFHAQGSPIATYCVGVLPAAEAGLLKGKRAVSYPHSRHHDNLGRLRELGADVVDALWVDDGGVISCRGPGSAIDVTLRLLDKVLGPECAAEVRRLMVFGPPARSDDVP